MILVVLFVVAIILGYYLNQHRFTYWSSRGFKQLEPQFFFGDGKELITLKSSFGVFLKDLYFKHKKSGILGIYVSYIPQVLITDPNLAQDILIRDFNSFHDRPMPCDEKVDPLSGSLFNVGGQKWKDLRVKLTPTFTSGKLKGMFPIIKNVGQVLEDYLLRNMKNGVDVFEFRDLMARYNTNIISSVAFGIDNDSINEPDHIFRRMGAKIFETKFMNGIKSMMNLASPKLMHKLRVKMLDNDVNEFIFSIVKQTVDYREKNNVSRNDFLQMLIQLKNQGFVSVDKGVKNDKQPENSSEKISKIDFNTLAAQVFVFFAAGFETSSSTMGFCLFELSRKPEIQKKIQQELDTVLESAGPEGFTYDNLGKLKYLSACIDETLRLYPPVPFHIRTAAHDYKVANSNLIIPKGVTVNIPVLGFQRDPEIYEKPMEFKPERFLSSTTGGGVSEGIFYTPFGDGPRNCIGMRLGKLTTKIGLAIIMSKFNLELNDKDMVDKDIEFHPNSFVLAPDRLFNIKLTTR